MIDPAGHAVPTVPCAGLFRVIRESTSAGHASPWVCRNAPYRSELMFGRASRPCYFGMQGIGKNAGG